MKQKIRFNAPECINEILELDCAHFSLRKEGLCNMILYAFCDYSERDYMKEVRFEKREYLQFTLNKKNRRYYYDLLKRADLLSESEILRKIFISYAILPPFSREIALFTEKIFYLEEMFKRGVEVQLDTDSGILKGGIEEIFRDKETGYLKMKFSGKVFFLSEVRIINRSL